MTAVVDTSVLIDYLRGDRRAYEAVGAAQAGGNRLTASVLTKIEVLAGMRAHEELATRATLSAIEWLEVDDAIAEHAGALAARYRRSHPGIEVVDYVIAATVERLGGDLLTRNRKHFPMFSGLPDPYR